MKTAFFRLSKFLTLLLILASLAHIFGCASAEKPAEKKPGSYEIYMDKAMYFYNKRAMKKAVELYALAANIEPKNPDPVYQKGLCLFRMDKFKEAAAAFKEVLKLAPDHYEALRYFWASVLINNNYSPQIKKAITTGIINLVDNNEKNPGLLYAAYHGFNYLADRDRSLRALKKSFVLAKEQYLMEESGSCLIEEMIAERSPERIIELAQLYINTIPDGRHSDLAFRTLIYNKAKILKEKSLLKTYLDKFQNTQIRHINRTIAYWYVTQNWDLNLAASLLENNIKLIEKLTKADKPAYMSDDEWISAKKKEKSDNLYLLALIELNFAENFSAFDNFILFEKEAQKRDIMNKAQEYLEESIILCDRNDEAYFTMAKLAVMEGDFIGALKYLKRSMEISDKNPEAKALMQEVLKKYFNYSKNPREYFLQRRKTVNFTEVTSQAGLAYIKATTAVWADYDKDNQFDLLLSGPRLFRNKGKGKFEEVSIQSGLAIFEGAKGGFWGDYNKDGYPDIFLISSRGNRLLENNKKGQFVDVTGAAFAAPLETRSESAAWGDFDNDGYLDLYVVNYERPGTITGIGVADQLYHNKKNGAFEDVTQKAQIVSDEKMCGRDVLWADFNGDARMDIYVSNYRQDPNFLWLNRGDGTFSNEAETVNVAGREVEGYYGNTIGAAFGDVNNDGFPDLFCSNLAHPRNIEYSNKSMLLMNSGSSPITFDDRIGASGITFEENSAKPILGDIDNDGDLDLYVTSTYPGQKSRLYLNDGKGQFTDITWISGTRVKNAWGCAFADFDSDSDLDLIVASPDGIRLFRNNLGNK